MGLGLVVVDSENGAVCTPLTPPKGQAFLIPGCELEKVLTCDQIFEGQRHGGPGEILITLGKWKS
jgi:hypothetical protein